MDNLEPRSADLILSCDQIREVDRLAIEKYGIPGLLLMENAARGCTDCLEEAGIKKGVLIVCGKGNNGGDGFAMARHLLIRGFSVKVISPWHPSELKEDAQANFHWLQTMAPEILHQSPGLSDSAFDHLLHSQLAGQADWIVDALLGSGTRGPLRSPFDKMIKSINRMNAKKFSIDIPSGLDADLGKSTGQTIMADLTGTLVAHKTGFGTERAKRCLGEVRVLDIGVPQSVVRQVCQDR